ncbi:hypothetical protein QWY28_12140 [Nocardioides sp. SOB77]|uniref:Uncharacterized protein n=1 Tax=Nocardioides oceani TaxID=3058369 RepID=A0ABT8FG88_9ACTN|nr:hypothetical protein [Nocardioides oceani]MDN4173701.1 hypothetical protein [Nocardioides oceani]
MSRVLLAAVPFAAPSSTDTSAGPSADASAPSVEQALPRLARALRDAGHEVVHAGQDVDDALVEAAAVQEDVELVVLLAPAAHDAAALTAALAGEAGSGTDSDTDSETDSTADDEVVRLVLTTPDEEPAALLARLDDAAGVADDTPYR